MHPRTKIELSPGDPGWVEARRSRDYAQARRRTTEEWKALRAVYSAKYRKSAKGKAVVVRRKIREAKARATPEGAAKYERHKDQMRARWHANKHDPAWLARRYAGIAEYRNRKASREIRKAWLASEKGTIYRERERARKGKRCLDK